MVISPDFLIQYALSKGVKFLYDADGNGVIDTRDVDKIAQAQQVTVRVSNNHMDFSKMEQPL